MSEPQLASCKGGPETPPPLAVEDLTPEICATLRATLYMAALVATRRHPVIRDFNLRLLDAGKPKKLARTARMRKLLTILNAIARTQTPWSTELACTAARHAGRSLTLELTCKGTV